MVLHLVVHMKTMLCQELKRELEWEVPTLASFLRYNQLQW